MKLKQKVVVQNIAILLFVLAILGTIITLMTDNYNLNTILRYLQTQGDYTAIYVEQYVMNKSRNVYEIPAILENDSPYLAAFLHNTVKSRVQIIKNTRLLGDSEDFSNALTITRPEVLASNNGKKAYIITKSNTSHRIFYYAVPIKIGNRYSYTIAFIHDLEEADEMRANTIKMFIIAGIVVSIITTLISIYISNRITKPVKNLILATSKFAKGQFKERITSTSKDEIGELSATFNYMANSIEEMILKLKDEKDKQKIFFDNFTHEIRTPLTTILGYAELLWKTDNQDVKDKSLFHITSEAKRMLKMIERLLELSRLKKYDFELNKVDTNLKKLIEDVCDSMHYKAKRYGINFDLVLDEVFHKVDPDLFKQVIINVIDNSIKYSKSSSIQIKLHEKDTIASLDIIDFGCGIDDTKLDNLFEPYYKVDKSRNSQVEGWGLGLSIVKEIIEKHGGEVIIESQVGKGTKFSIKLF